jgi:hypothetical protein
MKHYYYIIFLAVLLGCENSFEVENLNILVKGQVINESVGKPLGGLSVSLNIFTGSGWGGGSYVAASTTTDSAGNYLLKYQGSSDNNGIYIYINNNVYNSNYSTDNYIVSNGTNYHKTYLYQNTILTVHLRSQNPLEPHTYSLWLPGIGTSVDTVCSSTRAKGNFYNEVRLNYTHNGEHYEIIDSVYCPINIETHFIFNY